MIRIAIFASGAGTNAEKIIAHFRNHPVIKVALIVSNKPEAGVIKIAKINNTDVLLIEKGVFYSTRSYVEALKEKKIDWIILAGFLWKMPQVLITAYRDKIINIHPALLPMYGGKGMYGQYVHEAVLLNNEKESGITIHYVDEIYDHGKIILQEKCFIDENENACTLAKKIHGLEHLHYSITVEKVILKVKDTLNQIG